MLHRVLCCLPRVLALAAVILGATGVARAGDAVEKPHAAGLDRVSLDVMLVAKSRFFKGPSPFDGEKTTLEPTFSIDWTHFLAGSFGLGATLTGSGTADKDEKFLYFALGFTPKYFLLNSTPAVPYVGAFLGPAWGLQQIAKPGPGGTTERDVQSEWSVGVGAVLGVDVPLTERFGFQVEYSLIFSPFHESNVLRNGLLAGICIYF